MTENHNRQADDSGRFPAGTGGSPGAGSSPAPTGTSAVSGGTSAAPTGTSSVSTGISSASTGTSTVSSGSPAPSTGGNHGPGKAVAGPFTLREVVLLASVAVIFLGTLLPFVQGDVRYSNFWNTLPLFFVGIGILLPAAAAALVAGRRLGSRGLRVGSLSVDQFASVTAVLAATFFFLQTMSAFHIGPFISLIGALGMLTATVLAPHLPFFKTDFKERPETPAHTVARGILPAQPKAPKAPKPARAEKDKQRSIPVPFGGAGRQKNTTPDAASSAAGSSVAGSSAVDVSASGTPGAAQPVDGGATVIGAGASGAAAGHSAAQTAAQTPVHAQSAPAGELSVPPVNGTDNPAPAAVRSDADSDAQTRVHQVAGADTNTGAGQQETISATRSADDEVVEAFWFAVGTPRPVVDEQSGRQLFVVQPGDWEVGIEDRGTEFLVQDKRTGQIGVMRNLTNIERAPQE